MSTGFKFVLLLSILEIISAQPDKTRKIPPSEKKTSNKELELSTTSALEPEGGMTMVMYSSTSFATQKPGSSKTLTTVLSGKNNHYLDFLISL